MEQLTHHSICICFSGCWYIREHAENMRFLCGWECELECVMFCVHCLYVNPRAQTRPGMIYGLKMEWNCSSVVKGTRLPHRHIIISPKMVSKTDAYNQKYNKPLECLHCARDGNNPYPNDTIM